MRTRNGSSIRKIQRGAALVIAMIILLIITVLAVAGMKATRVSVLQAGNKQFKSQAFEAANSAIEVQMLDVAQFDTAWSAPSNNKSLSQQSVDATSSVRYLGTGPVPPSLSEFSSDGLFVSQNFEISSDAQHADSGALVRMKQGVYNIAPGTSK